MVLREEEGGREVDSLSRLHERSVGAVLGDSEARDEADGDLDCAEDVCDAIAGDGGSCGGSSSLSSSSSSSRSDVASWLLGESAVISGLEMGVVDLGETFDRGDAGNKTGVGSRSIISGAGETGPSGFSPPTGISEDGSGLGERLFFCFFDGLPLPLVFGLSLSSCFSFSDAF